MTIISPSSTLIDDSETVIAAAPAVKSVNDTIVSVKEIIIGETPIIISGPGALIFIPDTIIGGTPAIVSGSEIFMYLCRRENHRRGAGGSVPNSQSTVNESPGFRPDGGAQALYRINLLAIDLQPL